MQTYNEYLNEIGINKSKPIRIKFNYHARGFYCPTCNTGAYNEPHICKCGQRLLGCYSFQDK